MPKIICLVATIALLILPESAARAGSKDNVGRKTAPSERVSIDQIDHAAWDALLAKYCDERGYVDYQGWTRSPGDRQALTDYLHHLSRAEPNRRAEKSAQLAFWINAYNAVTIEGILREYPTSSIRNHTAKLVGYNIWDDLLLTVGERTYSLNQIEHDVLRKMGEPRIHFAIVCASVGCPPLLDRAYLPQAIDRQLTANTRRFFADRNKFRYDAARKEIKVSPILKWFAEDFGNDQAARLRTIAPFLPDEPSQSLARSGRASVNYLDYDWGLNDQAKRPRSSVSPRR